TLVAAYLIGSRGTPKHAVLLGLTVTLTHTLGVYALGLVTLLAARFIVPETLYPVITLASGVMVLAIGISLARARLSAAGNERGHHHHLHDDPDHHHDAHAQEGREPHAHEHGHHPHRHSHNHSHMPPERARDALLPKNLLILG